LLVFVDRVRLAELRFKPLFRDLVVFLNLKCISDGVALLPGSNAEEFFRVFKFGVLFVFCLFLEFRLLRIVVNLPHSITYLLRVITGLGLFLFFFFLLDDRGLRIFYIFVLLYDESVQVFRNMLLQKFKAWLVFLHIVPRFSSISELVAGNASTRFPDRDPFTSTKVLALGTLPHIMLFT